MSYIFLSYQIDFVSEKLNKLNVQEGYEYKV